MSTVVDSIVVEFIAKADSYVENLKKATNAHDGATASLLRLQAAARGGLGSEGYRAATDTTIRADTEAAASRKRRSAEEIAAAKSARDAERERRAAERADAKAAADAVKASEREKAAAVRATTREAEKAAAATAKAAETERLAADAAVAAVNREIEAKARLAVVSERASAARIVTPGTGANLGVAAGSRETAAAQTAVMGRTALSTGTVAAPVAATEAEVEINHLLADRLDLQQRYRVAAGAERAELQAELGYLQRINTYRRAGIADEEAVARAEAVGLDIEKARTRQLAEQQVAMERQMRSQSGAIAGKIGSGVSGAGLLGGVLAGGIGLAEVSHLNDKYIELTNSLRVAGVSAADFDKVQDHLLATANRAGADINALGDVYRGVALASHDLGASQEGIIKITDAAANALRIQGRSSTEARGALLQLSHAFESGRVTAREFNSLSLNLYPILQAVAKGSDQFGGSVAKLRQTLISTGISSRDFYEALIKGSDDLAARAATATLTTAQGFTALRNSLVVYFGEADKANGVSAALGSALQKLADNINILIPAIAAIGVALTVGYAARAVAAAAATEGLGASLLGAFGGPVGLAISAIIIGITAVAVASHHAAAASDTLGGVTRGTASAIGKLNSILLQDPSAGVARNARELANQRTAQANATYQAASAEIALRRAQAQGAIRELKANGREQTGTTRGGASYTYYDDSPVRNGGGRTARDFRVAVHQDQLDQANKDQQQLDAARAAAQKAILAPPKGSRFGDTLGGGLGDARAEKALATAEAKLDGLHKLAATATGKRLERIQAQIKKTEAVVGDLRQGVPLAAATAAEGGGTGRGRRGPSAETLARRAEASRVRDIRDDASFKSDLKKAHQDEMAAEVELSNDAGKRAELERQRLRDAQTEAEAIIRAKGPKDARLNAGVSGTGERTQAEITELVDANKATTAKRIEVIDQSERRRIADQAATLARTDLEVRRSQLQSQQELATTLVERKRIADELLDLDYKIREQELDATLAPDSGASDTDRKVAAKRKANLLEQRADDQKGVDRQNEGPGAAYRRSLNLDKPTFIQGEEVRALQGFNEELDKSVAKALHLHGLFGQIVGDLLDMAIKQALIKPLAGALFGGGGDGSGGGLGGLVGAIAGQFGKIGGGGTDFAPGVDMSGWDSLPGFANGGSATIGGNPGVDQNVLSINGRPSLRVGKGETLSVTPVNLGAVNQKVAPAQQNTTIVHAPQFNLKSPVVTSDLIEEMDRRSQASIRAAAPHIAAAGARMAPGVVQRQQTLGTVNTL